MAASFSVKPVNVSRFLPLAFVLESDSAWDYYLGGMEIRLAKDVEDFLQEQVRQGVCSDASNLVNDVLRALRDQQVPSFTVTPELEAWLLEAADAPTTPLTSADFAGIRERVRSQIPHSIK